jgi:hypothetical protein
VKAEETETKIFIIGVSKTGTTTLGQCLRTLGYNHVGYSYVVVSRHLENGLDGIIRTIEEFDSFDDWPWPRYFKWVEKNYPDAKFILSFRKDSKRWIKSYLNHCEAFLNSIEAMTRVNRSFFGYAFPHRNEEAHIEMYLKHGEAVRSYFKDKPEKLLEFCIDDNPSWEPLCKFLGKEIPAIDFPHANKAIPGYPWKRKLKRVYAHTYSLIERIFVKKATMITYFED